MNIYNYSKCFEWCVENMGELPDKPESSKGTFLIYGLVATPGATCVCAFVTTHSPACPPNGPPTRPPTCQVVWGNTGMFKWAAYSDGEDEYKDKYPCLPAVQDEYKAMEGIKGMYEFKSLPSGQVQGRRLPCRCFADGDGCRVGGECLYPEFGLPSAHSCKYIRTLSAEDAQAKKDDRKEKRKAKDKAQADGLKKARVGDGSSSSSSSSSLSSSSSSSSSSSALQSPASLSSF